MSVFQHDRERTIVSVSDFIAEQELRVTSTLSRQHGTGKGGQLTRGKRLRTTLLIAAVDVAADEMAAR